MMVNNSMKSKIRSSIKEANTAEKWCQIHKENILEGFLLRSVSIGIVHNKQEKENNRR